MGLQSLRSGGSLLIDPRVGFPTPNAAGSVVTSSVIDGVGESLTAIGYLILEEGPTVGGKLLSSAGGKIHWSDSGSNFDDPGTNMRIGIQDVGATGIEDGVFDVYGDVVGGTPISGVVNTTIITSGSRTLSHGDLIAVSWELTSVAGGDSVALYLAPNFRQIPYRTQDVNGAGATKQFTNGVPLFAIEFNDGTLGWFVTGYPVIQSAASTNIEKGLLFELPVSCEIGYVHIPVGGIASTDTFDIVIYKDPLGSATVMQTINIDPNKVGSSAITGTISLPITPLKVSANRQYAISIKPTAGFIIVNTYHFGVGNEYLKRATLLGDKWGLITRTGNDPFTYDSEALAVVGFEISKINDGRHTHAF